MGITLKNFTSDTHTKKGGKKERMKGRREERRNLTKMTAWCYTC